MKRSFPYSQLVPYLTLLLWVLPLVLLRSGQQSLMAHDEGIYATQARSILQTGDWVSVQWGGEAGFDRTIGIQWLIAACYLMFGTNEGTARLPSAIAFVLSVLLTYRIGCYLLNPRLAWLGAAIFSVIPLVAQYGRLATQDSVLVFIELLAIWALLEATNPQLKTRNSLWLLLAGCSLGWGFLIKGFMIIPAAVALLPYLIGQHSRHRHLTNPWLYVGLVLGALPPIVWLKAAIAQYGDKPIAELFGKLIHLKGQTYQGAGPFYYVWNIPANGFPWVFFALFGLWLAFFKAEVRQLLKDNHARLLLLGYPILLLVELSLFGTRTHYYPLQLMPFVGLLAAIALDRLITPNENLQAAKPFQAINSILGGFGTLLILAGCAATWLVSWHPDVRSVGHRAAIVVLIVGIGWLSVWTIGRQKSADQSKLSQQWLAGLLLTSWVGLTALNMTGLWGNYNPKLKTFLQTPQVEAVLKAHPVNFVVNEDQLSRDDRKTHLLLNFYTPQLGQNLTIDALQPGEFAWLDPSTAIKPTQYPVIGSFQTWQLVKKPLE
ncbi:phospholipid carrier-dependent glycosyltransferase [Phormidesmis priestleyi ULC007]|uniref:Phospholipid carrier-dependent glycosyltransferase n=1 Tax=Phormidesmis priestleyi ULC007 TaxID=1920490 RepID=A0A2T1DJE0_9CYAN|nr:glycosyltransferase family 39 protein [Phormidesmis priestleyi]PSB20606.1 phospholipid carrier-dependent glycosyltransferase [Phormidesmis priestleyi ULC007]PZO54276.1 MAG: phospholipid carrier-dependent glycosyltransferase [Phormidesmis priestleyi]